MYNDFAYRQNRYTMRYCTNDTTQVLFINIVTLSPYSMRKEKIELAKNILKVIGAAGVLSVLMVAPGLSQTLKLFNWNNKNYRRKFQMAFWYLKRKKFIKTYYKDGKEFVEITENGKRRKLSYDFENLKIKKPKVWDGLFRVVIFDIPEKKKNIRRLLRYKLKDMGFHPIQDSVLVTPYDCREEIDFLRGYLFSDSHVKYLVVKDIDDSDTLKGIFGL